MTDQPIPPALTPDEWTQIGSAPVIAADSGGSLGIAGVPQATSWIEVDDRPHALAAACLYKQPFGFTQEDVIALHAVADEQSCEFTVSSRTIKDIAAKIAALLPPAP